MLDDQIELVRLFNARGIRYLVVGGHAVGLYSEPRGTKDLDLWIANDPENGLAVFKALAEFGAPLAGESSTIFIECPDVVFQYGIPPARVDIMQSAEGLKFEEAWTRRYETELMPGLPALVLSMEDLITNKTSVGRLQDLADVERIGNAQRAKANKAGS